MRINNNIAAMNTHSRLSSAQGAQSKSLEKLSSGLRINRAGDDAAGLAISEKMRGQISGLNQASRNAQDGISLIQTAEGGLNETHSILQRMRELAVQSANDTNTDDDRVEIQKEMNQLSQEVSRISSDTQFNGKELLDGKFDAKFHIGANTGQNMTLKVSDMSSNALGVEGTAYKSDITTIAGKLEITTLTGEALKITAVAGAADAASTFAIDTETEGEIKVQLGSIDTDAVSTTTMSDLMAELNKIEGIVVTVKTGETLAGTDLAAVGTLDMKAAGETGGWATLNADVSKELGINVSSQAEANDAIKTIDDAITKVSAERSKLGSVQNRLDHTINNLTTTSENLSAAESRIRDVDMAKEMMEFTKNNILNQASTAMLAQANQMPQGVLQLLG
jgi:flagellin